jgi:hypothetical protein
MSGATRRGQRSAATGDTTRCIPRRTIRNSHDRDDASSARRGESISQDFHRLVRLPDFRTAGFHIPSESLIEPRSRPFLKMSNHFKMNQDFAGSSLTKYCLNASAAAFAAIRFPKDYATLKAAVKILLQKSD